MKHKDEHKSKDNMAIHQSQNMTECHPSAIGMAQAWSRPSHNPSQSTHPERPDSEAMAQQGRKKTSQSEPGNPMQSGGRILEASCERAIQPWSIEFKVLQPTFIPLFLGLILLQKQWFFQRQCIHFGSHEAAISILGRADDGHSTNIE
jgi:hypothetical protein